MQSYTKKVVTSPNIRLTYNKLYPNKELLKTNTFVHNTFITLHLNVTFWEKKHSNWKYNLYFPKTQKKIRYLPKFPAYILNWWKWEWRVNNCCWVCLETSLNLTFKSPLAPAPPAPPPLPEQLQLDLLVTGGGAWLSPSLLILIIIACLQLYNKLQAAKLCWWLKTFTKNPSIIRRAIIACYRATLVMSSRWLCCKCHWRITIVASFFMLRLDNIDLFDLNWVRVVIIVLLTVA